jgi:hypothetical protein
MIDIRLVFFRFLSDLLRIVTTILFITEARISFGHLKSLACLEHLPGVSLILSDKLGLNQQCLYSFFPFSLQVFSHPSDNGFSCHVMWRSRETTKHYWGSPHKPQACLSFVVGTVKSPWSPWISLNLVGTSLVWAASAEEGEVASRGRCCISRGEVASRGRGCVGEGE